MNTLANELKEALERLVELYREFHRLLSLEQGLIVANNARELHELVISKDSVAQKIQEAEETRLQVMDRIARVLGLPRQGLRVYEIAQKLAMGPAETLLQARNALTAMVGRVKALNEINNQLLNDSLAFVHRAFELVAGQKTTRQGYGQSGTARTAVSVARNLVNTRA
jgi:flagellar biosynthesis/type III secretory pathway chaperone